MKRLEELGINEPWRFVQPFPEHDAGFVIHSGKERGDGGHFTVKQARFIASAPRLYDALWRLVNEINRVIDHTPQGDCVIDCDCSGIELAKVEAEEAIEAAGGKDDCND